MAAARQPAEGARVGYWYPGGKDAARPGASLFVIITKRLAVSFYQWDKAKPNLAYGSHRVRLNPLIAHNRQSDFRFVVDFQ
jgi:hypothetical protein